MKRLALLWWVPATVGLLAAANPVPEITLRINGHAATPDPIVAWSGEPIIAEVDLRHSGPDPAVPLGLDPPDGGWSSRITIVVTNQGGGAAPWHFVAAGEPSAGSLALQPRAITTLVLRLNASAAARVTPGRYQFVARLHLADGRSWQGSAKSEPVEVEVTNSPPLKGADLGQRQLLRVRDALLTGDIERANIAAAEMVQADFQRPEGFVALALVSAAQSKRSLALLYLDRAISLSAFARASPAHNSVPLAYHDLRRRFEQMPSGERGDEQSPAAITGTTTPDLTTEQQAPAQGTGEVLKVKPPASALPTPANAPTPHTTPRGATDNGSLRGAAAARQTRNPGSDHRGDSSSTSIIPASPRAASQPVAATNRLIGVTNSTDQGARDPTDFPRLPGSVRQSYSSVWQKTHSRETVSYRTNHTVDASREFFVRSLAAAGWERTLQKETKQGGVGAGQVVITWRKGSRSVTITFVETESESLEVRLDFTNRSSP